jgi:hypothetical protein
VNRQENHAKNSTVPGGQILLVTDSKGMPGN